MKSLSTLIIFLNLSLTTYGQSCVEKKISKNFDFEIIKKSLDSNDLVETEITVLITKKVGKSKAQILKFKSEFLLKSSFVNCSNNYINYGDCGLKFGSIENDFGDLIITDLNFDGREDLAIKREEGGNGGPIYFFYIQTVDEKFIINDYLSKEMMFFPVDFDFETKTLQTYVRMNSSEHERLFYQYSESEKSWKIIERQVNKN
jgi:hypothetical protein